MKYRVVKDYYSNAILAVEEDNDQGGQDYEGRGFWVD
jgi:hypothetical protein